MFNGGKIHLNDRMKFYSLNNPEHRVTFREAVINGIAPDKGLYFPEKIQPLPPSFFEEIESLSNQEIAYRAIQQFVGDSIPKEKLSEILHQMLDFDFPLVSLEENIAVLELFHGPTMAFKDVGARFMAHCLGYFSQGNHEEVTVLVATSGDTGGAVANGFLGVKGVQVVILYPSGKVSEIQEKQLTTLGQNITALEVAGTFDDCQQMVKKAFLDKEIGEHRRLTSANSINVARWLPQLFYFLFAYKKAKSIGKEIVFAVKGDAPYSHLKFESGVHRVQRIPVTESQGRIHTSTATVAVLPEAEEAELEIDPSDLRVDTFRASGHGGQSVNTTDSAVRITHVPTGIVVSMQDEKSQIKNKAKAMNVLRSRLLAKQIEDQQSEEAEARRKLIGSGDRSEKIRTYNYPQDRITDHRIGFTRSNLPGALDGAIDDIIEALHKAERELVKNVS